MCHQLQDIMFLFSCTHVDGTPFILTVNVRGNISEVNTSRPGKNASRYLDIFNKNLPNENYCRLIKIALQFIPRVPIDNTLPLVQVMAWCCRGDITLRMLPKYLYEHMEWLCVNRLSETERLMNHLGSRRVHRLRQYREKRRSWHLSLADVSTQCFNVSKTHPNLQSIYIYIYIYMYI